MLLLVNPSCRRKPYISFCPFLLIISAVVPFLSSFKMGHISSLAVIVAVLIEACWADISPEINYPEWPQAGRVFGNWSSPLGIAESKQDLFGRQACGQGYGQCSTIALNSRTVESH
jgi:hypothetical protein